MREKRVWSEELDGFSVEYVNWGEDFSLWNYYVYFTAKNTPVAFWEKLLAIAPEKYSIRYSDSWLAECEWHGGITYASFERGSMQDIIAIKAGCDYSHLGDEGCRYELADMQRDCASTIASAKAQFAL